jgi:hypothetical protein
MVNKKKPPETDQDLLPSPAIAGSKSVFHGIQELQVINPWYPIMYPIIKQMYLNVHVSDHVSDQCLQWIYLFFCRFPILLMHENPWFCQEMIYKWWVFHMVMVKIGISKDRRLNMDQYL